MILLAAWLWISGALFGYAVGIIESKTEEEKAVSEAELLLSSVRGY